MLTLDAIKNKLEHANLKKVAEAAGVHYNALYRLMKEESDPKYETVRKLSDYLEEK